MTRTKMRAEKHRALVLQGGGSLGAYEAGVYRALYEKLADNDQWKTGKDNNKMMPFNTIAGTSIGAINAAIIVSYVAEKGTWEGSEERLEEFWEYLGTESLASNNPYFSAWWDYWCSVNENIASSEAARRYYSAKQFSMTGVSNVFLPLPIRMDMKFLDPLNLWYCYDNKPLKKSLERFARFPIATSPENNQPRLLLLSVDVQEGKQVIFDSYEKKDGSRRSEYGKYFVQQDGREIGFQHLIKYDSGLRSEHVMASASFPVNFDYTRLEVETMDNDISSVYKANNGTGKKASDDISCQYKKEFRCFWDGGLLANTPLAALIVSHRNFWHYVKGLTDTVPHLTVYIANLHPIEQEHIPLDRDGVLNRNSDITFRDKTLIDEQSALLITDYVNMVRELIEVAKENGVKDRVIQTVLKKKAESRNLLKQTPYTYQDLLLGWFGIDKVIRIERKNDANTISNKTFDFSRQTIRNLLDNGYRETLDYHTHIERGNI
jgi:NTE family protein